MSGCDVRLVVSVQIAGFDEKPQEGHLATGLLVSPDQVLVPAAPAGLPEAAEGVDLLVLPLPLGEGGRIERLRAERLLVADARSGDERGRFAVIRMANASRHQPSVGEFTGCELDAELRANEGDLWAALEAIGAVPAGAREAITPELLREVPAVEQEQRRPVFENPGLVPGPEPGVCQFIPVCKNGGS